MKTIFVPLLWLGFMPVWAFAGPEKEESRPGPGERRPHGKEEREVWGKADLDGDGKISREEFLKMPRIVSLPEEQQESLFKRLDRNGDGFLDGEELARPRHPGGPGPGMKRIWELDVDKSGGVSFAEFEQGEFVKKLPAEKRREIFDRLDTDGDGQLTPADRPEPPPRGRRGHRPPPPQAVFRQLDKDQDGRLSLEEFRELGPVRDLPEEKSKSRFEAMDLDKDGFLSRREFAPPEEEKPGE